MLAASDTDERAGLFGVMVAISPGRHGFARLSYKRCAVGAGRPEQGLLSASGCARQASGRIRRTREPAAVEENSIEAPISLARRRMLPSPRPGTLRRRVTATVVDHVHDDRCALRGIGADVGAHRDLAGAGVLEYVGERFLQDSQHLQDLVRTEVGQRRQVGDLPEESQSALLHAAFVARTEVGQHREQVAFDRIARIDDQAQIVERAAQDRLQRLEARVAFDHRERMHELTADAVVHVRGHALALRADCTLAFQALQPRVVVLQLTALRRNPILELAVQRFGFGQRVRDAAQQRQAEDDEHQAHGVRQVMNRAGRKPKP